MNEVIKSETIKVRDPKPGWLKVKLPTGENYRHVKRAVDENKLHTICQSGNCPNMGECWGAGTATFMILGDVCTRSCGFCAVKTGLPTELDWDEPMRVAKAIKLMGVKHAVITSVNRDELKDGGAAIWAATVTAIRQLNPDTTLETLIPDFRGNTDSIDKMIKVAPEIVSHNMETVKRLYRIVRPQAKYDRSLAVIKQVKEGGIRAKSGIMLGLGETKEEVYEVMDDLRKAGCEVMTLGQYLRPTVNHLEIKEWIHPDLFKHYEIVGLAKGFRHVESGPLVRSSYHAEKHLK